MIFTGTTVRSVYYYSRLTVHYIIIVTSCLLFPGSEILSRSPTPPPPKPVYPSPLFFFLLQPDHLMIHRGSPPLPCLLVFLCSFVRSCRGLPTYFVLFYQSLPPPVHTRSTLLRLLVPTRLRIFLNATRTSNNHPRSPPSLHTTTHHSRAFLTCPLVLLR